MAPAWLGRVRERARVCGRTGHSCLGCSFLVVFVDIVYLFFWVLISCAKVADVLGAGVREINELK